MKTMTTGGVRVLEIDAEQAGQRVDNFLLRELKGVPKTRIYRILRKGEVRVNKGRIKPTNRLQAGDQLRIPPIRTSQNTESPPEPTGLGWLEQRILLEDERLLVLNKPSGMAVHGGSGLSYGVIEALRALRPDARFLELVHRLDRDTSGCLVIAKRRSQLRTLHELLRHGGVEKRYLALVQGAWQGGGRTVDAPLRKNTLQGGERMVRVDPEGKASRSRFLPQQVYRDASLVEVLLDTGRTHQIRVHAAHIGHPLAGDEKYGDAAFNRSMQGRGLRRLFLHAHNLSFHDPDTGRDIDVSAPLDTELRQVLDQLEQTTR